MSIARLIAAALVVSAVASSLAAVDSAEHCYLAPNNNDQNESMVVKTYSVADYVVPIVTLMSAHVERENVRWQNAVRPRLGGSGFPRGVCEMPKSLAGVDPLVPQEEQLIRLITDIIAPNTWSDVGGNGTIEYRPCDFALVVKQTPDIQEQVATLLEYLRRLQNEKDEVKVELRLVSLSPKMARNFMTLAGFMDLYADDSKWTEGTYLNDRQLARWMDNFNGDRATTVMQCPKITVYNGQKCNINVGDEVVVQQFFSLPTGGPLLPIQFIVKEGLFANFLPVISDDHGSVRLQLDLTNTASDKRQVIKLDELSGSTTFKLDKRVLYIPDGQTVALRLGKTLETTHTDVATLELSKIPVLGELFALCEACDVEVPVKRIPYIGRLFAKAKDEVEERVVFVLVTTRVIANEESELEFTGEVPRIPR